MKPKPMYNSFLWNVVSTTYHMVYMSDSDVLLFPNQVSPSLEPPTLLPVVTTTTNTKCLLAPHKICSTRPFGTVFLVTCIRTV